MKLIIIANWKMNPETIKDAKSLFGKIKKETQKIKFVETVICPPFVWLAVVSPKRNEGGLLLGAQNVCFEESGAFTGEVSASMLSDLAVEYIIVGHSERRKYFNETNFYINKKIKELLKAGLKPILCVGENKQEFDLHLKPDVLEAQITEALKDVEAKDLNNIIFVYEPVWAISTNEADVCSTEEVKTSVDFMRKIISELYSKEIAVTLRFVYGGSVSSYNSGDYLKNANVNGLLVGAKSLDYQDFISIVKSAEQI